MSKNLLNKHPSNQGRLTPTKKTAAQTADKDQIAAKEELTLLRSQYHQIAETAQEGICMTDANDCISFVNNRLCEIIQRKAGDLIGQPVHQVIPSGTQPEFSAGAGLKKQAALQLREATLLTSTGGTAFVSVATSPALDRKGVYTGSLSMITDITHQKRTEQEMVLLINNTEECFLILDRHLKIIAFNKQYEQLSTDYLLKKAVKGDFVLDYTPADKRQALREIYDRVLQGSEECAESTFRLSPALAKIFAIHYKPAKDGKGIIIGAFVTVIDITERRNAEIQRESERRNKEALINSTEDLLWSINKDFKLIAANQAFLNRLKGFTGSVPSPGEDVSLEGQIPGEILTLWKDLYTEAQEGTSFIREVYTPASATHPESWAEVRFSAIYDGALVTGVACYARDSTERKRTEISLIKRDDQLRLAAEMAKLGYWEQDVTNDLFTFTDEFYAIFKTTAEKAGGYTMSSAQYAEMFVHPDDQKLIAHSVIQAIKSKDASFSFKTEHRIIYATGELGYISVHFYIIKDEKGRTVKTFGVNQDITEQKTSELKLREAMRQQSLFEAIVRSSDDAIISKTLDGTITSWNHGAELTFGYTSAETIGKNISLIIPADRIDDEIKILQAVRAAQHIRQYETERVTKDGSRIVVSLTVSPLLDWNGSIIGTAKIARDITAVKHAKEQNEKLTNRLRMATRSANMGIWEWDLQTNAFQWDEAMYQLYRIDKDDPRSVRDAWLSRISPDQRELVDEDMQVAIVGQKGYNTEFSIVWDDQSVHYIRSTGIVETDAAGNTVKIIGLNWDVTEPRLAEIHLSKLNADIEKHVKKLAESNAELEQFAYVASHDLQEPLRMVTAYLSQLEKKYGDLIDEKGKQYIHFAVDGARRMRRLILDLLEFSRLGRMDDQVEEIDLNALLQEIQLLFLTQIEETKATIHIEKLPTVQFNRAPLRQVFQNLIGNALKYISPGIPPQILLEVQESEEHYQFSVKDNGIGIDKEYFEKIFVIFQRLHSNEEFSGTGIGLAVTRKLVENMGGTIWVDSTEGQGSSFFFTLPKQNP